MRIFHKLCRVRKYAWVILSVAIFLILLKALIFPNTIDILVVTILFVLLLAIMEDKI